MSATRTSSNGNYDRPGPLDRVWRQLRCDSSTIDSAALDLVGHAENLQPLQFFTKKR
jgi:hypothetical protein